MPEQNVNVIWRDPHEREVISYRGLERALLLESASQNAIMGLLISYSCRGE